MSQLTTYNTAGDLEETMNDTQISQSLTAIKDGKASPTRNMHWIGKRGKTTLLYNHGQKKFTFLCEDKYGSN